MSRRDLRSYDQIRELGIELNVILEANGSCKFTQGSSTVIAVVYGPTQPRYSRFEEHDRAALEIDFNCPSISKNNFDNDKSINFLKNSLTASICLTEFPRQLILIQVTVIQNDGSILSVALNACTLALIDAGIPMTSVTTSISCMLYSSPQSGIFSPKKFLFDPDEIEEIEQHASCCTFSFPSSTEASVIASYCVGKFTSDELLEVMELCFQATLVIRSFIYKCIDKNPKFNSLMLLNNYNS